MDYKPESLGAALRRLEQAESRQESAEQRIAELQAQLAELQAQLAALEKALADLWLDHGKRLDALERSLVQKIRDRIRGPES